MTFLHTLESTSETKLVAWLERGARTLLLATLFFVPLVFLSTTTDPINFPKELFLTAGILLTFFCWLLTVALTKVLTHRQTFVDKAILAFFGVTFLSALFSRIPSVSFFGKTNDFVFHVSALGVFLLGFFLIVQYIDTSKRWRQAVYTLLLSGVCADFLFLARSIPQIHALLPTAVANSVSGQNSIFAVTVALFAVMSAGFLLLRSRHISTQVIPLLSLVLSLVVLVRVGFFVGLVTFAVGIAAVIILGVTFLSQTRVSVLSAFFALFLGSLVLLFFGTPLSWKVQLPVEVALGFAPTWDISREAVLSTTKTFFVGSGPGTFTQIFSLFRSDIFNKSTYGWVVRFEHPYTLYLGMLSEVGVVGTALFVGLILLGLGGMGTAWWTMRPSAIGVGDVEGEGDTIHLELFVLVAAFLAATISFTFIYPDLAFFWLWWVLFALTIVGISARVPSFIYERRYPLVVSPQYSLVASFGVILVATILVIFSIVAGRWYIAEASYTRAVRGGGGKTVIAPLERAAGLRQSYAPYHIALAEARFDEASSLAKEIPPKTEEAIQSLSSAINAAREGSTAWGQDVTTWQTLALMYQSALPLSADAATWSKDAFEKAIVLEPTNPILHWRLGLILSSAKDTDGAIKEMKEAIRLKSDYLPAYFDLSTLYEQKKDLDSAINLFSPIFTQIADNEEALFTLGRLFYNRDKENDLGKAEQVWLRAAGINPKYVNVLYALGVLYEKKGDKAKSADFYKRAYAVAPNDVDIKKKVEGALAPTP